MMASWRRLLCRLGFHHARHAKFWCGRKGEMTDHLSCRRCGKSLGVLCEDRNGQPLPVDFIETANFEEGLTPAKINPTA